MNKETKKKFEFGQREIGIAGVLLMIIVLIIAIALVTNKPNEVIVGAYGDLVNKSEQSQIINLLDKSMQEFRSKNTLLTVDDSNTPITMLYNSHGEAISEMVESGAKTFYMNDHHTVQFSESISHGKDSDVISILENAIAIQKEAGFIMLQKDRTDDTMLQYGDTSAESIKVIDYMIDIRGWDQINKLYGYIDTDFANAMVENLKNSIKEMAAVEGSTVKETDELNIRLEYTLVGDELYSGACYVYFGDKESKYVSASDMQRNWYFDGYIELYDWKLSEDWYTTNWDEISDDNIDVIEDLFERQYNEILDMLDKFSTDNGIETNIDETTQGENQNQSSDNQVDTSNETNRTNENLDNTNTEENISTENSKEHQEMVTNQD